ncbi:hypothetical protein ACFE04_023638 [Oxalis oulophora]
MFEEVDVTMIDKRAEMGSQLKKVIPMTLRQLLDEYDTLKQLQSFICRFNLKKTPHCFGHCTYVCKVKVDDIECDRSWCYQGCKFCKRSFEHYENSYWCKNCGVVDGTLPLLF